MGKPKGGKFGGSKKPQKVDKLADEDMYDEIDMYHKKGKGKGADLRGLSDDDDELDMEDLSDEEGVMDLELGDEDEEDSDYDSDEDIDAGGSLAKLAKQERAIRQKLKLQQGEEEEGEERAGEDPHDKAGWGAGRKSYYNADNIDYELTDDEDAPLEEEREARRMQREAAAALRPEDLGLDESDESESDGAEDGAEAALERRVGKATAIERAGRDTAALGDRERLDLVMSDAPELLSLLDQLQQSLAEVRSRVAPILTQAKSGSLPATDEGLSYLEAKHLLLLSYCTHIVFYLLLKAEGRPTKDHPVILRLVQLRAFLEKVRPIDRKLQYQVDKLVQLAQRADDALEEQGGVDALQFRPRPGMLVGAGAEEEAGGAYRPPKLNPVTMEGDAEEKKSAKEMRKDRDMRRRALQSDTIRELAAEAMGMPEEQRTAPVGMEGAGALRERQKLAAREALEEDLMIRVPMSKDERKRLKQERRKGMAGAGLLSDFADDMADLVEATERLDARAGKGGIDPLFLQRQGVSAKFGGDPASAAAAKKHRSGDDDLAPRESLADRRARTDSKRARESARAEEAREGAGRPTGEEDAFYRATKEGKRARKEDREAERAVPSFPPLPEEAAGGFARKVTTEIIKNRGLTPHRNKELKNPRKKNRLKFEKALVRRKGQVQEAREGGESYGGEATGIKSKLAKSTRF